jgi:hypothetical protein
MVMKKVMTMFVHVYLLELGLIMLIFLQGNKTQKTKNMEEDVMIYLFVLLLTTTHQWLLINILKRELMHVIVLLIPLMKKYR